MNYETTGSPFWPHDKEPEPIEQCDSCGCRLEWYEIDDPCIIGDQILCDRCASELIRAGGYGRPVSEMTHSLKMQHAPTVDLVTYVHKYFGYGRTRGASI